MLESEYQSEKSWIRNVLLGLLLVCTAPVSAGKEVRFDSSGPAQDEGVVKLVATLHDSPAFTDVIWKLYHLDVPESPVMVINRHSATVNLQAGHYRAVASLKSTVRSQRFNLEPQGVEEVVLSMDEAM